MDSLLTIEDGVYVFESSSRFHDFEKVYIDTRREEDRVLNDEQVANLPDKSPTERHVKEWEIRHRSSSSLLSYLADRNTHLSILDLGCGNGWFSNMLAEDNRHFVLAADVNLTELKQAARIFSRSNLVYLCLDIFDDTFKAESLDIIVANSVIQYFNNLQYLIDKCLYLLKPEGEFHILDSPIYKNIPSAIDAKHRTKAYYSDLNMFGMENFYFHHSQDSLHNYETSELYSPHGAIEKTENANPFPWIKIRKPLRK